MNRLQKLKSSYDDSLLKVDRIPDIVGIDEVPCLNEDNPETWHVQVSLIVKEFLHPLRSFFNINVDVSHNSLHFSN